jgi:hypothetical protein
LTNTEAYLSIFRELLTADYPLEFELELRNVAFNLEMLLNMGRELADEQETRLSYLIWRAQDGYDAYRKRVA